MTGAATHREAKRRCGIAAMIILGATLAFGAAYVFWSRPLAPDVEFTTLDRQATSMKKLRGKIVYVNFWATSCATCTKEMPDLVRTYERFAPRGLELLAVAMKCDPPSNVTTYTSKHTLPFKVVLDSTSSVAAAFHGVALSPTAVLTDRHGRIFSSFIGEPNFAPLHAAIERELAD